MPQMAPISWLMLFIVFSATFIMFNMLNYFSFLPQSPKSSQIKKTVSTSLNWKW